MYVILILITVMYHITLEAPADVILDGSSKSLDDLPDEILLQVFSHIDPNRSERVLGYLPDDPPPNPPDDYLIEDFLSKNSTFCNLALASKRFRYVVQEHLLFAPIIGGLSSLSPPDQPQWRIACFLRTILARPSLGRYVKEIRLCLPLLDRTSPTLSIRTPGSPEMLIRAHGTTASLENPEDLKTVLEQHPNSSRQYTLTSALLLLLPQLERLVFSDQIPNGSVTPTASRDRVDWYEFRHGLVDTYPGMYASEDSHDVQKLPIACTVTYVKISSLMSLRPNNLDIFPNLRTMDISLKLAGLPPNDRMLLVGSYRMMEVWTTFNNIRHLRLDCQVKTTGIWDLCARVCMSRVLGAFCNLESLDFYAEESCSKNPFSSVRSFPYEQSNIQSYPYLSSALDYDELDQPWDGRIQVARTQYTDYQILVDAVTESDQLKSLRLPGGFWTLPGAMRKMLTRFNKFTQLQSLIVPQAAIISINLDSMSFADTDHADFHLLPSAVLPTSLQHLKIFDADADLLKSDWLRELFDVQMALKGWPQLKKLEILLGPLYDDSALRSLQARHSGNWFWEMVDQAPFQVCVARDDEVPSVCV
jgi:hypothetical protein